MCSINGLECYVQILLTTGRPFCQINTSILRLDTRFYNYFANVDGIVHNTTTGGASRLECYSCACKILINLFPNHCFCVEAETRFSSFHTSAFDMNLLNVTFLERLCVELIYKLD